MPHATPIADRRKARCGFTLTELLVVLTIMAVMTAISAPCFYQAIKQSRADAAAANLRALWAAERLFWLENHAYTNALANLRSLGLLDPEYAATDGYSYSVALTASGFTATGDSAQDAVTITIDENGTVQATGITLGFQ